MSPPPFRLLLPLVAAGGALGALARHGAAVALPDPGDGLPVATLLVNLTGCLALGVLVGRWQGSALLRAFVGTGVLGGFTTFSAFALETDRLLPSRPGVALLYVLLSVGGGLVAVELGRRVVR